MLIVLFHNFLQIAPVDSFSNIVFSLGMSVDFDNRTEKIESFVQGVKCNSNGINVTALSDLFFDTLSEFNCFVGKFGWIIQLCTSRRK